jgi:hypothetical protein
MTGQAPERIIIDGRPRSLYADPLYRLLVSSRFKLAHAAETLDLLSSMAKCVGTDMAMKVTPDVV